MGSERDPRMDLLDYRPDLRGHVEGPADTPQQLVQHALAVECPDCNINVFIEHDASHPSGFVVKIAHDERCPWLAAYEREQLR